jgi:hypothetical protein
LLPRHFPDGCNEISIVAKKRNDRAALKDHQRLVTDLMATLIALGKVQVADSVEVWQPMTVVMHAVDAFERNLRTRPVPRILPHSILAIHDEVAHERGLPS